MAWDMVDRTKGLSEAQRKTARSRILSRAKELGVDTKDWHKIDAMSFGFTSLSAMALECPHVEDHPNRVPFSGILTRVDQASDMSPHGAFGRRVFISKSVAEQALPSLLGMAVDYREDQSGHDRRKKIGVIMSANLEGDAVHISGFLYGNDFKEEVAKIQDDKDSLGFSFEAEQVLVGDLTQDPLRIESLCFTGAAILEKKKAAYMSTSLAAAAEESKMEKEQFDTIMASIKGITDRLGTVEEKVGKTIEASSVADKVKEHADALKTCAAGMEAAGVGAHPTRGHVHVLRHMADNLMAEAHQGRISAEYHAPGMYASASLNAAAEAANAEIKKEVKELREGIASITTILKDVQAKAATPAPDRKTLPARISSLLAKGSVTLGDGEKLTVTKLDAALKGTSLSPQDRMELKIGLERAGILEKAA